MKRLKVLTGLITIIFVIISMEISVIYGEGAIKILVAEPINEKPQNEITIIEGFNSVVNGKNTPINIFYTIDNIQMIQLRATTEALGYLVTWDTKNKKAFISKNDISYEIVPDSNIIYASYTTENTEENERNTVSIELMIETKNINGSIYISTDFFDILGADIIANDEIIVINDYDYIQIKHDMISFSDIHLGMPTEEVVNILGNPLSIDNDITIFVGAKTLEVFRYNYNGLLLDFDNNQGLVGINLKEKNINLTMKDINITIGSNINELFETFGERDGQRLNKETKLFYNYVTDTAINGIRNSVVFVTEDNIITEIYMSIIMDASIGLEVEDFIFGDLKLGSSEKELIKVMGKPISQENSTSSAVTSEIETKLLKYDGIEFHVNKNMGIVEIIYNINFFPTSRGIKVGDTVASLFEKYGMVEISDLEYERDGVRVYYDYRMANKLNDLNYGITFTVVNEIITVINAYTII